MSGLLSTTPGWPWAAGIAIGFPLLLMVTGEVAARLARRHHPLAGPLAWVRLWVLPALALLLLLRHVAGIPAQHMAVRLATTVLWVLVVAGVLSIANALLFERASAGSWQRRVPALLRDLVRLLLVALAAAIVYSTVWDKDISGALTALGVTSIVVGLALQEPLGNLFSGVMLLMERPFEVGDDIEVGGISGVVREINWRSVHVRSLGGIQRIIPNSTLNKETLTNYSRPKHTRMEIFEVAFSYDDPPNRVHEVLLETARGTPDLLQEPAPIAATWQYGDSGITYRVIYRTHEDQRWIVRNELATRLWYAARRHGLTMPFPTHVNIVHRQPGPPGRPRPDPLALLGQFPKVPVPSQEEERESLQALSFGQGEVLFAAGAMLEGVFLLVSGAVALRVGPDPAGADVGVVQPGEFFGEAGLYGRQSSELQAVALRDCVVLRIAPDTLRRMFESSPALAREAGATLDARRRAARAASHPDTAIT